MCSLMLIKNKKQTVSQQVVFRSRSHGMSAALLPEENSQQTLKHFLSVWARDATTELSIVGLLKSPALQPDVDVICADTCICSFHLAANIHYTYFPMYLYYWLWRSSRRCQGKLLKGLKIKQHIPLQMWSQSTMRQCVSAISGPERGSWADPLPIILFPEQTEQTRAIGWSSEHLWSSAPLCRPAPCLAGPAFVLLWQRVKHWVSVWPREHVFTFRRPSVHAHGLSQCDWTVSSCSWWKASHINFLYI